MTRVGLAVCLVIVASGCTDADVAHVKSWSNPATVELYSGGQVVAKFRTTGKVNCTTGGICDFMDADTKRLVRTTGDIVVRVQ